MNDGTVYPASGKVARVNNVFSDFRDGISIVNYGEAENIPEPEVLKIQKVYLLLIQIRH